MTESELRNILLIEVHRLIADATRGAMKKLGKAVPMEARSGFLSESDASWVKENGITDVHHPAVRRFLAASTARIKCLSYPPDGDLTDEDIAAIESLQLTDARRSVMTRVIGEACKNAFFHFFCLLDSVADPQLSQLDQWHGARFEYPRNEGPMLHDELGEAFFAYRERAH